MGDRSYRGYRVYAYIALTRLFHALDLDLQQPDLTAVVAARIERPAQRVSKEELLHAIRSNSHMTEKVIDYLLEEKFATVAKDDSGYDIRITALGVDHLRSSCANRSRSWTVGASGPVRASTAKPGSPQPRYW